MVKMERRETSETLSFEQSTRRIVTADKLGFIVLHSCRSRCWFSDGGIFSAHRSQKITSVLVGLVLLDLTLSLLGYFGPELWFRLFHGVAYNDPQGFLRRSAANWTAFLLIQLIALLRWKKDHMWLKVVAGVRFSDLFTDLAYLLFCSDITLFGRIALMSAGPANLLVGLYLWAASRKAQVG